MAAPLASRPVGPAMQKGARLACPACGEGRLYRAYLKVADCCGRCGQEFSGHRADDAPPYFTILIVAHIVVGAALAVEQRWHPDTSLHLMLWLPLTLVLSLALLPPIKGALIGLQWALRMHGFGSDPALPQPTPGERP